MQAIIQSEKLCLNASELMARLSISPSTLYKLVKTGKLVPVAAINAKRNRLFNFQDVLDLLKSPKK
jgi:predicted site-specific integrase-resolvase